MVQWNLLISFKQANKHFPLSTDPNTPLQATRRTLQPLVGPTNKLRDQKELLIPQAYLGGYPKSQDSWAYAHK